jgi:Tfp pilus assembly protein PilN
MRPVNLIPPEERRDARRTTRTGPLVYVVLGGLAALLVAVVLVVTTDNTISDRKAEKAKLEQQQELAQAKSAALRSYAQFESVASARLGTVESLAQSRFDWERVLRQLSLILPTDVWLVKVTGTVSSNVQVDNSAAIALRQQVQSPALEMIGCGRSQDAVARFVSALRNIDGVTRVTVNKSERPTSTPQSSSQSSQQGGTQEDCRTRDTVARFEIVAAFDNVQLPAAVAAAGAAPATGAQPPTTGTQPPANGQAPTSGSTGTASAQQQQAQANQATQSATDKAQAAAKIVPGT